MTLKRGTYYPRISVEQRKLLFKTWEETGDIDRACETANVSRRTFYNWKARFEADGYDGLIDYASRAPKNPRRTPAEVEQRALELREENPNWGKKRIARELANEAISQSTVSSNTVKRILQDAGLWPERRK